MPKTFNINAQLVLRPPSKTSVNGLRRDIQSALQTIMVPAQVELRAPLAKDIDGVKKSITKRLINIKGRINLVPPQAKTIQSVEKFISGRLQNVQATVNVRMTENSINRVNNMNNALQRLIPILTKINALGASAAATIRSLGRAAGTVSTAVNKAQNGGRQRGGTQGTQSSSSTRNIVAATGATKQLAAGTTGAAKTTGELAKNLRQAGADMENFGVQTGLAFKKLAAFAASGALLFGFARAIDQGVKDAIEFETELIKLSQVTGTSVASLQSLRNEVDRLSVSFGIDAGQILKVSRILAQAGFTAQQTKLALESISKTELLPTFVNLERTTEGVIAAFKQFKLEAKDISPVLGSINTLAAKFPVESDNLIGAIQRVGGVFAATAGDLDDNGVKRLQELLAIFTGIRGTTRESAETVGTGLRTVIQRLQRPTTIAFLKELDERLDLLDKEGRFIGVFKAFEKLNRVLSDLGPGNQTLAKIIEEIAGTRQASKLIPAIRNFDTIRAALDAAVEGSGSLSNDPNKALTGLARQFSVVRSQFQQFIRELTDSSAFKAVTNTILQLAKAAISLAEAFRPVLPLLAAFAGFKAIQFGKVFGPGFIKGIAGTKKDGANVPLPANTNAVIQNTAALKANTIATTKETATDVVGATSLAAFAAQGQQQRSGARADAIAATSLALQKDIQRGVPVAVKQSPPPLPPLSRANAASSIAQASLFGASTEASRAADARDQRQAARERRAESARAQRGLFGATAFQLPESPRPPEPPVRRNRVGPARVPSRSEAINRAAGRDLRERRQRGLGQRFQGLGPGTRAAAGLGLLLASSFIADRSDQATTAGGARTAGGVSGGLTGGLLGQLAGFGLKGTLAGAAIGGVVGATEADAAFERRQAVKNLELAAGNLARAFDDLKDKTPKSLAQLESALQVTQTARAKQTSVRFDQEQSSIGGTLFNFTSDLASFVKADNFSARGGEGEKIRLNLEREAAGGFISFIFADKSAIRQSANREIQNLVTEEIEAQRAIAKQLLDALKKGEVDVAALGEQGVRQLAFLDSSFRSTVRLAANNDPSLIGPNFQRFFQTDTSLSLGREVQQELIAASDAEAAAATATTKLRLELDLLAENLRNVDAATQIAGVRLTKFNATAQGLLSNTVTTNFTASSVLGNTRGASSAELVNAANFVTGSLGGGAAEARAALGFVQDLRREIPAILQEGLITEQSGDTERAQGIVRGRILKRFGSSGDTPTLIQAELESFLNRVFGGKGERSLTKLAEIDPTKFVGDLAERIEKAFANIAKSLESSGKQFVGFINQAAQLELKSSQQITSLLGLQSRVLIERLTRFNDGNINLPRGISTLGRDTSVRALSGTTDIGVLRNRAIQLRKDIAARQAELQSRNAVDAGFADIVTDISAMNVALTKTTRSLEILAKDTSEAADIQRRLNNAQKERVVGRDILSRILTGGPTGALQIFKQLGAAGAVLGGDRGAAAFRGADADAGRKLITEILSTFGDAGLAEKFEARFFRGLVPAGLGLGTIFEGAVTERGKAESEEALIPLLNEAQDKQILAAEALIAVSNDLRSAFLTNANNAFLEAQKTFVEMRNLVSALKLGSPSVARAAAAKPGPTATSVVDPFRVIDDNIAALGDRNFGRSGIGAAFNSIALKFAKGAERNTVLDELDLARSFISRADPRAFLRTPDDELLTGETNVFLNKLIRELAATDRPISLLRNRRADPFFGGLLSGAAPRGFAGGGTVTGSGRGDRVPALLEPKEFVVNRNAALQFLPLLRFMNLNPSGLRSMIESDSGSMRRFRDGMGNGPIGRISKMVDGGLVDPFGAVDISPAERARITREVEDELIAAGGGGGLINGRPASSVLAGRGRSDRSGSTSNSRGLIDGNLTEFKLGLRPKDILLESDKRGLIDGSPTEFASGVPFSRTPSPERKGLIASDRFTPRRRPSRRVIRHSGGLGRDIGVREDVFGDFNPFTAARPAPAAEPDPVREAVRRGGFPVRPRGGRLLPAGGFGGGGGGFGGGAGAIPGIGDFTRSATEFATAAEKIASINIPEKITIEGRHTVDVNINGAAVLSELKPAISDMIVAETNSAIQRHMNVNTGETREVIAQIPLGSRTSINGGSLNA